MRSGLNPPMNLDDTHALGLCTETFTIYLQCVETMQDDDSGEPGIEYRMVNRFIKNMDILEHMNPERPIIISMKTGGGDLCEGLALYDTIKSAPNPTTILSYTQASSMSSIVLQAANKRVLMPSSHVMLHEGSISWGGTLKQARSDFEFAKWGDELCMCIYIQALKGSKKFGKWGEERVRRHLQDLFDTKEEVYYTAEEAIESGLADEIYVNKKSLTDYTGEQLCR